MKVAKTADGYEVDGEPVPRVTRVLKPLTQWFGDEAAMERGTAVHHVTALRDEGFPEPAGEDIAPYVCAWERFKADTSLEVVAVERVVAHPTYRYAGTLDRIVRFPGGTLAVVDLKTSYGLDAWIGVQLAAYREAWNFRRREKVSESCAVSLRADGSYGLQRFNDHAGDFAMFTALLTEARWKEKNGWK